MKETLVFMGGVVALLAGGGLVLTTSPWQAQVEQPIAFNHAKHSPILACTSCHSGVEVGAAATIPQADRCMLCHQAPVSSSPEAAKVKVFAEQGRQIPWVRLFDLRDDLIYTHKPHIQKGLACQTCHGDIGSMARITQGFGAEGVNGPRGRELMGRCLSCHQARGVSTDCVTCHK